jgi:hypothetical protein
MAINIDWRTVERVLGGPDKAFGNAAGLAGTFLKSKGENDRADRQMAMNNEQTRATLNQRNAQFAAEIAQALDSSRRNENLNRAVAGMNASRLGENEMFATKNRILSSILPNLRNVNITPGNSAIAAAMPKMQGFLPEGGIPASALAALSEGATASAIANRNKQLLHIDPRSPLADFGAMGFAPEAGADLTGYRQKLLDDDTSSQRSLDETIQRALAQDYEGIMRLPGDPKPEEKKGGFWSKFGGVLKAAAPIAAAFIPGVGPAVSAAIAAGGSVAGSKLAGEPWKDALLGGALAGAGNYGASRLLSRAPLPSRPVNPYAPYPRG